MAKLSPETLTNIFQLQQRLIELIDEASATEMRLFEQFGETEATLIELEELQTTRERLRSPYVQINTLLLRVAEYQPTAPNTVLNLLLETVEITRSSAEASQASILEVKRNWNLP